MRILILFSRSVGMIVCDIVAAFTGAAILWSNANSTVLDVHWVAALTTVVILCVLLSIRYLLSGRTRFEYSQPNDMFVDRIVIAGDILLLATLLTVWQLSGSYFLGWVAVFSATTMLLANSIQLMLDVTSARNSVRGRRALRRPIFSVEVMRLFSAFAAMVGVVVTSEIHEWNGRLLSPLTVLTTGTIALAAVVCLALNRIRNHADAR